MDHREIQRWIALLLSDRRQDPDPFEADVQSHVDDLAGVVAHFDDVLARGVDTTHFGPNRMASVAGQAVDAGADHEVRAQWCR